MSTKTDTRPIAWFDEPREGGECLIWETDCGRYRIDEFRGVFVPRRLRTEKKDGGVTMMHWEPVFVDNGEHPSSAQNTLDAAMNVINVYHCQKHDLVLV